ncbi:MAG: class I SAM-dependent methyltransferase [Lentisphaerae bacterium]|nr:class I SAM-dependent methyltransferase [Lentisphaerota bacterium]
MAITHCRICGRELFPEILLELKNMPAAAQNFPTAETLADDHGIDLELRQCSCCGVVQLTNPPVPYFRDVIRAAGCSPEMHAFRLKQFSDWLEEFQLQNAKILEVGCGKGEYLEIMREAGGEVYGTEHLDESVQVCRKHGLNVEQIYFEHGDEKLKNGPFGGFFILNWLEHIPDLHTFLQGIRNNLTPDAAGLVEVPNFDMMLKKGLSAEFTADHLYYFTEETFRVTLESCGFQVLSCRSVWHDYILSANVRRKQPLDTSLFRRKQQMLVREINAFAGRYGKTAIWGAGHQSLAVMAMAELDKKICYVVDSAPFKQGKFTHATHLPIVPPDTLKNDTPDAVLVMCAGFSDEVARILREQYDPAIRIGILREDHVEELPC